MRKNVTKSKKPQEGKRDKREVQRKMDLDNDGYLVNCQKSKANDPRWYAQNPQLLVDAASFPYSWPVGNRLNLGEYAPEINAGSVPGVMAINTAIGFGYSDQFNSPINVAARNIYSYVRHANSGHANYDAPDLMLYLCAMDSLYAFHSWMKRIYGVVQTYSYTNRYYPVAVVNAMNVNFDSIQANLANFRAYINSFAVKVGSMCIPASMSFMARHMWMYSGLYLDTNQNKPQTYLFNPAGFYGYTLNSDGSGMLQWNDLKRPDSPVGRAVYPLPDWAYTPVDNDNLLDFDLIVKFGNAMLDAVLSSEDMNIMSGDILKAFGPENVYKIDSISETYTVLPVYDEEVLSQIENASLMGHIIDANLTQDPTHGYLVYTPHFKHPWAFDRVDQEAPGQNAFMCDRMVTLHKDNVTPADTMVATRLTNISSEFSETQAGPVHTIKTMGSEVATDAVIYFYRENVGDKRWDLYKSSSIYIGNTVILNVDSSAGMSVKNMTDIRDTLAFRTMLMEQISQFDWHPPYSMTFGIQDTYIGEGHVPPMYGRLMGFFHDINQYAVLNVADLEKMADVALLSEFNITQYGRAAQ